MENNKSFAIYAGVLTASVALILSFLLPNGAEGTIPSTPVLLADLSVGLLVRWFCGMGQPDEARRWSISGSEA